MTKKKVIIPIFVPHLGCPHRCSFCDQHRITGSSGLPQAADVENRIQTFAATAKSPDTALEIGFYGGSFTMLPLAYQEELLQPAFQALQAGVISLIRVSTRPDGINPDILEFLDSRGVRIIELGVQSLDPEVLELCRRGHTADQSVEATRLIKKAGMGPGIQLMIGLPGDTPAKALRTAHKVVELHPDFVRIYPALVLKDTDLEMMYRAGTYIPMPLSRAVALTADLLIVFGRAAVPVIRAGLQPNEALLSGETLVAGPFHPSFRELAESKVMLRQVEACLDLPGADSYARGPELTVFVSPPDLSRAKGEYNCNLEDLRARYQLETVRVKALSLLARGEVGLAPGGTVPVKQWSRQELLTICRIETVS